ncbi:MBL fold metallo-hydrolase [Porticoccaceae bacterium]|nr:MBL fold metallo-hydrolase [Porticoccaceae bacterium]MDB4262816.1 MBL fold metallo-hydrolase [Porticoccaceae bacterium]MDB9724622.1 MBL fold metallo-hydrolase [bacterium]MDC0000137.1 MBL fold metallo-hydrolase [Porticoccaceae bacterium]MDC0004612.1 MBL fold metallo-hydrolase [Porticoccaceae bacterium]
MRFASLGSGSKGNATLIEWRDTCVMVDCGFSIKETTLRMAKLGKQPQDLSAILVTHEHSDHWKGVMPLANKFGIKVYLTAGCLKSRDLKNPTTDFHIIDSHTEFQVGDLTVTPVPVPHDAREPVQYLFNSLNHKLGVLTDIGSLTPHVEAQYDNCHGLLLEANHDLDMLAMGPYPAFLKDRVSGQWGHLNNQQTARLLANVDQSLIQQLVIGHISDKNNSLDKVRDAVEEVYTGQGNLHYACQQEGFDWLELI